MKRLTLRAVALLLASALLQNLAAKLGGSFGLTLLVVPPNEAIWQRSRHLVDWRPGGHRILPYPRVVRQGLQQQPRAEPPKTIWPNKLG